MDRAVALKDQHAIRTGNLRIRNDLDLVGADAVIPHKLEMVISDLTLGEKQQQGTEVHDRIGQAILLEIFEHALAGVVVGGSQAEGERMPRCCGGGDSFTIHRDHLAEFVQRFGRLFREPKLYSETISRVWRAVGMRGWKRAGALSAR